LLHYEKGWLSGYDYETVKTAVIVAGLPVIDSREVVAELAIRGMMIAVSQPADPPPWDALSYAPLVEVAEAYGRTGADVRNFAVCGATEAAA
jgi:hypothetical protein